MRHAAATNEEKNAAISELPNSFLPDTIDSLRLNIPIKAISFFRVAAALDMAVNADTRDARRARQIADTNNPSKRLWRLISEIDRRLEQAEHSVKATERVKLE